MGRNTHKKRNRQIAQSKDKVISDERLINIYAEAYYRALKRIEQEKENTLEENSKKKNKWYVYILLGVNIICCPFRISKRFKINPRMYDGLLVIIISEGLECVGILVWLMGLWSLVCECQKAFTLGISAIQILNPVIYLMLMFFGSFFFLAGKTFGEEKESNRVYAYSASLLALVSCILSLVALLGG